MKKVFSIIVLMFVTILLNYSFTICQESRVIQKTVEMNKDGHLFIDTYKGSITIETWDKSEVNIVAKIEADGHGRHEAKKVQDTEIRIHSSGDEVEIKTDYDRIEHHNFSFFGIFGENSGSLPFVHYTIKMPATAKLKIKDYKSDTKISDLKSSIKLNTYKGTVDILGFDGPLDLETYKGDVKVDYSKYTGEGRYETYKGKIELSLPKDAGFKLDADIGHRADFISDFNFNIKRKSHDEEYYRATVNGGGPALRISTEKGDIRINQK